MKSEPALELISRAGPSMEAHHSSVGPDAGRNSGGRRIIKINKKRRPMNSGTPGFHFSQASSNSLFESLINMVIWIRFDLFGGSNGIAIGRNEVKSTLSTKRID